MNELLAASEPCRGLAPQTPPELLPLPGKRDLGQGQEAWVDSPWRASRRARGLTGGGCWSRHAH